jgi:hypothetical protein
MRSAKALSSIANGANFTVPGWIVAADHIVVALSDNFAILNNDSTEAATCPLL